jgi:hypothetical protein
MRWWVSIRRVPRLLDQREDAAFRGFPISMLSAAVVAAEAALRQARPWRMRFQ